MHFNLKPLNIKRHILLFIIVNCQNLAKTNITLLPFNINLLKLKNIVVNYLLMYRYC